MSRLRLPTAARACALAFAASSACGRPTPSVPPLDGDDAGVVPCDGAPTVTPEVADVATHGLVQLVVSGGSGAPRFALGAGGSGGEVNAQTGAFRAGDVAGATDVVTVTDAACPGAATATIRVHPKLRAAPAEVRVPPATSVRIVAEGGSGSASCAVAAGPSGGSLAGCTYTTGAGVGTDRVRVTDDATGDFDDAVVVVDPGATFDVAGAGGWFLPVGARFAPSAVGGSGVLAVEVRSGGLTVDGGALRAESPGPAVVRVRDAFVDVHVDVPVAVLAPLGAALPRDGERSGHGVLRAAGDIDGDGYDDAVAGFIDVAIDASFGGAAMVYAGGPGGLAATPVRVLGGGSREETLGRDVLVADLDADGHQDLVVGVDKADHGGINAGQARIYAGVPGGFFADTPTRVLYGPREYGRFGAALAAGDFDGDGWLDLAVGAVEDADTAVASPADTQGAVHVFRGGEDGFGDEADFVLFGELPTDGGAFAPQAGMQLGGVLAAADLDGDGLSELVAGAPEASIDGDGGDEDGAVMIYRGTLDAGLVLTRTPAVTVVAASRGDAFGRRVAVGDVDGDGVAELAVSGWKSDARASAGGGVWLFRGLSIDGGEPAVDADAGWRVHGARTSDYLGADVDLADVDGDGGADLVVGAYRAGTGDPGAAYVWTSAGLAAAPMGIDATDTAPDRTFAGPSAGGRLGQAVAAVGDANGDGVTDLAALAGYDSAFGIEAGAIYALDGATGAASRLDMPGVAGGHAVGQGLAWFDVDGDGQAELLAGAPDAADADVGANAGVLLAWTEGLAGDAAPILGGHVHHDAADRFGYAVAAAGDFDADGYPDLAVIARKDSRPSAWGVGVSPDSGCVAGAVSEAGAVFVYRGGPGGLDDVPAFVVYGDDHLYGVEGGFDHDGDGYDDLLLRSRTWTDAGGYALVYGRDAVAGVTRVVCDLERYEGADTFDRVGYSGAVLGDVDGDGCDEVAVGATGEELDDDHANQGTVRVLWGWGGPGCAPAAEVSTLTVTAVGTGVGASLAGGGDVDGDGVPDLVVGAAAHREGGEYAEVGAAWLVPGWHLAGAPREPRRAGVLDDDPLVSELLPAVGLDGRWGLVGTEAGGLFGEAVALVPDPLSPGRAAIAVGAPRGDVGGGARTGGVAVYRWGDGGLGALPWALIGGEAGEGELGATLLAVDDGGSRLFVGAPSSSAWGVEVGAVYAVGW